MRFLRFLWLGLCRLLAHLGTQSALVLLADLREQYRQLQELHRVEVERLTNDVDLRDTQLEHLTAILQRERDRVAAETAILAQRRALAELGAKVDLEREE